MTWMLKLYPRAWRERYGAEVEELVASQPGSLQLFVDLLGGAIDAYWKPQLEGETSMLRRWNSCCASRSMTRNEAMLGSVLCIGSALTVAGMMLLWPGDDSEKIAMVMVPGVLAVGGVPQYLRGHSAVAKIVLTGGLFAILFGIGFLTTLV